MARVWKHSDPVQRFMRREQEQTQDTPTPVGDLPARKMTFQEMKRRQEMDFAHIERMKAHNDPGERDRQRALDRHRGVAPIAVDSGNGYRRKAPSIQELKDADDFICALGHSMADDRHPDSVGVSRRPEPKSIYSKVPQGNIGVMDKPKMSSKPKGGGKDIKLWPGNTYGQLDPYMYRTSGKPRR